jgi:tRNA(Ile)-lysidine synthase
LPHAVEHPHLGTAISVPRLILAEGTLTHDGWQLDSHLIAPGDLPADWRSRLHPWRLFCDAEQSGELYLTTPQPGMRITPLGMDGHHRSVGDIFTDQKVAPYLRPGWPVVVREDGTVAWLCGLAMSETVRIHAATQQVRQLLWQPYREVQTAP